MSNSIICSGFPASYPLLTGTLPLTASHRDLTRSMITVGYPSRRQAIATVGYWRMNLLKSMMRGYLDRTLCTTAYFRNLEPSEKTSMTFLLAQAFTHWFAQKHMKLFHLIHVKGFGGTYTASPAVFNTKAGAAPLKTKSRPDFIGMSANGYHVFETKGRSSSPESGLMAKALSQVSMIANINGTLPVARVACCFTFLSTGVRGHIIDPEPNDMAWDLEFDEVRSMERAYGFFLENAVQDSLEELIPGFQCTELGEGIIFGVDTKVLSELHRIRTLTGDNRTAKPLLSLLQDRQDWYSGRRDDKTSVGNDGIILIGKTTLPKRRLKIRKQ